MILRRLGNKQAIAHKIVPHFPKHNVWIEPFFGAGGMFFNKPRAKYNFLNDLDGEVINCFDVLMKQKEELSEYVEMMPYCERLWYRAKTDAPRDNVERAAWFLLLSNCGYMGKPDTMSFTVDNNKEGIIRGIENAYSELVKGENRFTNSDFRSMIAKVGLSSKAGALPLIYCDAPYLDSTNNYSAGFTEQDSRDLFDLLQSTGFNFAMSEFDHPFILQQAAERKLNVITIGERVNMKNRRTEILVTNYPPTAPTLF